VRSAPATGQGARKISRRLCNPRRCDLSLAEIAGSVSLLFISRLCGIPGCTGGGRTTRPRSGIYLPSGWFPSALQGEIPLGNALVVVAKEGRRGAFGQVGEFRRLFSNPLRSRWAGHSLPPLHPVPPRMTGSETSEPRSGGPHFHMPRHDATAKNGTSGCRNAAVGANFGDCCMRITVCLGEHVGGCFPVPARERRHRLHGVPCADWAGE
jgi:hypothetical protein